MKARRAGDARAPRAEDVAAGILAALGDGSVAGIYRLQVRPLRTRRFTLQSATKTPPIAATGSTGVVRSWPVEVLHTLLGIELKVGKKRLICPDLATARFLAVFARLGVDEVAVPYEITRISHLADQLESAWFQMLVRIDPATVGLSRQMKNKVRRLLIAHERDGVMQSGSGPAIPQFNQNTKQRKSR